MKKLSPKTLKNISTIFKIIGASCFGILGGIIGYKGIINSKETFWLVSSGVTLILIGGFMGMFINRKKGTDFVLRSKIKRKSNELKIKYFYWKINKRTFFFIYTSYTILCFAALIYFTISPLTNNFLLKILPTYLFHNFNYIFIFSLFLSIIEAQFFWNKFTEKQLETNEILTYKLDEKNREITESIEYALRIQTAILPPKKIVKQYLENSFILYKPKDIVAGDFYWMETINDLVLFAACDCTGHGVPGAMVSVVCHNALNRTVKEFGLTQPAAILDKTTEIVIENFSKSEEDIKDGMDISLCAYHAKTKTIQWAGANNPLWMLQNGELIETKADKQPIGMNENSKPFTNHTFTLNNGDTIYLFTDGFADQFGGEAGEKKLTRKRFKELLLGIQDKSMQEQGITLDKFIVNYRKEIEQIDDILVMGVKV